MTMTLNMNPKLQQKILDKIHVVREVAKSGDRKRGQDIYGNGYADALEWVLTISAPSRQEIAK